MKIDFGEIQSFSALILFSAAMISLISVNAFPRLSELSGYLLLRAIVVCVTVVTISTVAASALGHFRVNIGWEGFRVDVTMSSRAYATAVGLQARSGSEDSQRQARNIQMSLSQSYNRLVSVSERLIHAAGALSGLSGAPSVPDVQLQVALGRVPRLTAIVRTIALNAQGQSQETKQSVSEFAALTAEFAELLAETGDAEILYRIAIKVLPTNTNAALRLTLLLTELGRLNDARVVIQEFYQSFALVGRVNRARILTQHALVEMWDGAYSAALGRLREAEDALVSGQDVQHDRERLDALFSLLNMRGGLYAQMGEMNSALTDARRAVEIGRQMGDAHNLMRGERNLCTTLIDSGRFREAYDICEDSYRTYFERLADRDPARGLMMLNRAHLFLRLRRADAAMAAANYSHTFYSVDLLRQSARGSIRGARVQCLRQKILYAKGEWQAADIAGQECVSWTQSSSPGRAEDIIDGQYYLTKTALRRAEFERANQLIDEFVILGAEAPHIHLRAVMAQSVLRLAASALRAPLDKVGLDRTISDLIDLEQRSGMLLDVLNDALVLSETGSLHHDYTTSIERLNEWRTRRGARLIEEVRQ